MVPGLVRPVNSPQQFPSGSPTHAAATDALARRMRYRSLPQHLANEHQLRHVPIRRFAVFAERYGWEPG